MNVGGNQGIKEFTGGTNFWGMRISGTPLHDVKLHQHSLRHEHQHKQTHLISLGRLYLLVCGGLWLVVHAHGEHRYGLWNKRWFRLEFQDGHLVRLTHLDRLGRLWLTVASDLRSLAGICTGSGFMVAMRSEERLGRSSGVGGRGWVVADWRCPHLLYLQL